MLIRIRSTLGLITPLWVLLLWVGVPHFVECRRDTLLDEMEPVKEEDAGEYLQQFGYVGPSQLNVKTEGKREFENRGGRARKRGGSELEGPDHGRKIQD